MGCAYGFQYGHEESLIQDFEDSLNFSSILSKDFDIYFYKHCKNFKLTEKQFVAVMEELNIDITESISRPSNNKLLFEKFIQDELYDKRAMASLGIMLGKGSLEEKVKILFLNYDIEISDSLDPKEIKVMITDILEIALVHIPKTAKTCINNINESKSLKKYCFKLNKYKAELAEYYKKLLIKDYNVEIKVDDFVAMFENENIRALLYPSRLRAMAFAIGGRKKVQIEVRD
ncbi:hypothetical protein SteCoe_6430 [Stentor coeruleus]|uniref:EF-hand domain-containing protein n=1 Tax=Stentor coeruleus TaxID=5963 RepID=A0A1R2CQ00_9CILI|nr:hypothetical protein SteCoe_6430 [Stentor coeruleus]